MGRKKKPHVFTEKDDKFIKAYYLAIGPFIGSHDLGVTDEEVKSRAVDLGLYRYADMLCGHLKDTFPETAKEIRKAWTADMERSLILFFRDYIGPDFEQDVE